MRKRVLALLVASAMLFSMLAGCGNKVDLSAYDGIWAEEDLNYENGGFIMTVTTDDDITTLFCEYADEGSGTTSGGVSKEITSKDIRKNVVTIEDAEDDWGNVVDMNITFNKDTIVCEVTEIKEGDAIPVSYKGTYTLARNEDALQILSETPWDDAMGVKADDYAEEPVQPTYDTSKASGILAQAGLTEEQFRAQCIPLYFTNTPYDFFVEMGKQYLQQHPEEDKTEEKRKVWQNGGPSGYANREMVFGNEQGYVDSYYHDLVHDKLVIPSGDLVARMFEYPADYKGKYFVIPSMCASYKGSSADGSTYYEDDEMYIKSSNGHEKQAVEIWDYRDDTNYPTIREKDRFDAYVIFLGVDNDDDMEFALVSVDKVEK